MTPSPLILFFRSLADRFRRENDLSDMTWAMCEASAAFRRMWIRFFFGEALDPETVTRIEREVTSDNRGSRVDFLLRVRGGDTYLIEVKIGDRNQHFGKYDSDYDIPPERFGYITNYPLNDRKYKNVRQWSAFYYELSKADGIPEEEQELFQGYLEYLRSICGIVMLTEKIEIDRMSALYALTLLVEELSAREGDRYVSKYWKGLDRREVRWLFFHVKYADFPDWPDQYLFIGIWFKEKTPRILGGFDKRATYAKEACEFLNKHRSLLGAIPLEFCSAPDKHDGEWYLNLSEEATAKFCAAATVDEQKELLKGYMEEITKFPIKVAEKAGEW